MTNKFLKTYLNIAFLLLISSCEEEGPYIDFAPPRAINDTTYISDTPFVMQNKGILIEDFSGVRCPNCPAAADDAKNIADNNPGRVSIIAIHPLKADLDGLTKPFIGPPADDHYSKYDFRTNDGNTILQNLGGTGELPIGAINRKKFPSENYLIRRDKWATYSNSELLDSTPVNIYLTGYNFNSTTNELTIKIKIAYTKQVSDSINLLSIAVIEDDLESVQERKSATGSTEFIENYVHMHVLRGMVTSSLGEKLNASYVPKRVFEKTYKYIMPSNQFSNNPWNKNLEVVVFVDTSLGILHAQTFKVH